MGDHLRSGLSVVGGTASLSHRLFDRSPSSEQVCDVSLPAGSVPNFDVVPDADDGDIATKPDAIPGFLRDHDTTGFVHVHRTAEAVGDPVKVSAGVLGEFVNRSFVSQPLEVELGIQAEHTFARYPELKRLAMHEGVDPLSQGGGDHQSRLVVERQIKLATQVKGFHRVPGLRTCVPPNVSFPESPLPATTWDNLPLSPTTIQVRAGSSENLSLLLARIVDNLAALRGCDVDNLSFSRLNDAR